MVVVIWALYSKIKQPPFTQVGTYFIGYFLFAGQAAAAVPFDSAWHFRFRLGIYFEEKKLDCCIRSVLQEYQEKRSPPFFPAILKKTS